MKLSDFNFQLPETAIARFPQKNRSDSRLLCLDKNTGGLSHCQFHQITDLIQANDLLVFNDTRVIPARLFASKETGGHIEIMIEHVINDTYVSAFVRASKAPKPGMKLILAEDVYFEMIKRNDEFFELQLHSSMTLWEVLERHGEIPLPPYIKRETEDSDKERYQTIYAKHPGAVAAPTAGLHFDAALLKAIHEKGVATAFITLHVGAGTFQPIRVDDIQSHQMHHEFIEVNAEVCQKIEATKAKGGRVIAVGTTTLRALESISAEGKSAPFKGTTDIFIYPGYTFKCVDALITNFHLPGSTLLLLVSALAGKDAIFHAYQTAIAEGYRFYSYGDAMFIA